jgi:hypothetical protein
MWDGKAGECGCSPKVQRSVSADMLNRQIQSFGL